MSIEVPAAHFESRTERADGLKIARSDFIEAFNKVDAAIRAKLTMLDSKPQALVGQNIDALRKIQPNPKYSKADKARVDDLLDQFTPLQTLRCDVVHSLMEFAALEQAEYALFANVQNQPIFGRKMLVVTLTELHQRTEEMERLARDFCHRGSTG